LDIWGIQVSPTNCAGAISKTPIENRGLLLKEKSAPSPQVPEPRASYRREKSNARVFLFLFKLFFNAWFWYSLFFRFPFHEGQKLLWRGGPALLE
jgi:hypothetical protein